MFLLTISFFDNNQTLFHQFLVHNNVFPLRLLVYRNGSSDGEFDSLQEREIAPMRAGLMEALKETNCDDIFMVPITYVVCQTQHSICVTPTMRNDNPSENVWSGTCVDDPVIMDYRDGQSLATRNVDRNLPENSKLQLFEDVEEHGYDFILTSHGGLKGTSKVSKGKIMILMLKKVQNLNRLPLCLYY